METIAVYWEPRIKVYGITDKRALFLSALACPAARLGYWSERIMDLDSSLARFELVTCHGADKDKRLQLFLVVDSAMRETMTGLMAGWLAAERSAQFTAIGPVDMVFLHGPHFQDRFGIAETAFAALAKKDIPVKISGCAGTSMYLVVAEGQGDAAVTILTDTFFIPTVV